MRTKTSSLAVGVVWECEWLYFYQARNCPLAWSAHLHGVGSLSLESQDGRQYHLRLWAQKKWDQKTGQKDGGWGPTPLLSIKIYIRSRWLRSTEVFILPSGAIWQGCQAKQFVLRPRFGDVLAQPQCALASSAKRHMWQDVCNSGVRAFGGHLWAYSGGSLCVLGTFETFGWVKAVSPVWSHTVCFQTVWTSWTNLRPV